MSKPKNRKKRKSSRSQVELIPSFWKDRQKLISLCVLLCLTALIFWPASDTQFVNWDDDRNVYDNELIQDLSPKGIKEIFTNDVIGNYNPLTILTFAVERAVYGQELIQQKKAFPFVLLNILLHLLCIYFVYRIGIEMKLSTIVLIVSTVLFALHPMRVESVSWVTERKDVLYSVFFFASIYQYLLSRNKKDRRHFYIALALMIPACLAKIQAVSLPLAMLAIDFYLKRPIKPKLVIEKIPFFAVSLVIGLIGVYMLKEFGSLEQSKATFHFGQRLLIGSYTLVVFLIKSIAPYEMVPLYPYPASIGWQFTASLLGSISFGLLLIYSYIKRWRIVGAGLLFFFVNVVFMLQILGAGQGFLADRFTYVAYLGLFWIIGLGVQKLVDFKPALGKIILSAAVAVGLFYSYLTFQQKKIWHDSANLWTHVLSHYDKTPLPHRNRGNHYRDIGQADLALVDYSSAIKLEPTNHKHFNSRGKLYFMAKKNKEAIADYTKAIALASNDAGYYANRGAAYAQSGNFNASLQDLTKCISINPKYATGLLNRSLVNQQMGRFPQALQDITAYLAINSSNHGMWLESSKVKLRLGNVSEALTDISNAIKLAPNNGKYYGHRAAVHLRLSQKAQARADIAQAQRLGVKLDPKLIAQSQ